MSGDPWEGILDPDEEILWQGAPAPGVQIEWDGPFQPIFFLFFTGFSVFWMVMAASMGGGPFWMFGLIFFGVGAYNLVGVHFWKALKRRGTFYTLTDKRAFIATDLLGRRALESHPIRQGTTLRLEPGRFENIWFAEETTRVNNRNRTRPIGFERLTDAREVMGHLRAAQQRLASKDR